MMAKLDDVVNTPYTKAYRKGNRSWFMDCQNAFTELELLGKLPYADEKSKKRKIFQTVFQISPKIA